ncbi:3-phenylpropionate-dihydrodiol/cinnamic acid-dihydrodiol dehydrogenase [Paraburkholderia caballeronis]|uniref:3-phenylpropionate-dihydrodiol/cinnamic acid-dihydrodiol dehydrogenase n=1 Tax=Paraburkholderia caballeronis TaxID=416943 RepID=UPI0010653C98|nr:3-phenylpropionate-dihydrodiol/cinnamic acid-dihydrodiol dehydrogenase [Paraburkholderia caballeronis]TDV09245.1 2,3-dihydroxy-2,3-dihydrophenylpropionate dehydrogenase [Paraburkholderia caballeronis]TDV12305.1 2,3-dihydroxy-2,3-dihydrophenylpropionate dehydrogenase [Paraburkholderia caballeronis]TDV22778.1 2,3-dihydroxy-2,3-dihydrophenylpropionate dehydrogenase [Paraburkholderia caballeronis]
MTASTRWLDGEVALITGGGSGLGLALVERFLDEGASVCVLERSADKVASLRERFGARVAAVQGDVTSYADNERAVATAVDTFGKLDTFIGNAAIWDHGSSLVDLSPEQLDNGFGELFSINVKGYLLGAKAASRALIASEGSMIFTLSNSAFYPGGGGPLYTASKHAAVGIIRQLAYELAPKVRVNGVGPCGMASDLRGPASLGQQDRRIMDSRTPEAIAGILPLQFFPSPADFTGPFVLLASRANNRTLSGVMINADAGLGIRGIRHAAGGLHL